MTGISVNTEIGQGTSINGLASGIETGTIIKALVEAERVPITHLTKQQEKAQGQQEQLHSVQTLLQQLASSVEEFALPSLYESSQKVTSSDPTRVAVAASSGAGPGGYQVEVKQLANSAQRTFQYTSPEAETTVTIDGREYTLAAKETAKELAAKINSDSKADVYAAVLGSGETIVLSTRATGVTEGEFIKVSGSALTEKAGTAREGRDAEYSVDGVEGKSASNVLTEAIPGLTLTLTGVTTATGPVTIDVQPPAPSTEQLEAQIQSFVKLYNATVEAVQRQLTTKPLEHAEKASEYAVGSLFGDTQLMGLLTSMRTTMYEAVEGLPTSMSSPYDIGLGAGLSGGSGTPSQASIEGLVKLEPGKLSSAISEDPEAVQKMLQGWSKNLQKVVEGASGPGGTLAIRIEGEETQITQLRSRITTMNEALAVREKAIVQEYAEMEAALARNSTQLSWLTSQSEQLAKG